MSVKKISVNDLQAKDVPKLPGVPERILKKQKQSNGSIKYLVKWRGSGNDEASWECEDTMQAWHKELIEDFNFFALTGERYDEKLLEQRRRVHSHGNYIPPLEEEQQSQIVKRARKLPGVCRPALKEKDIDNSFDSKRDKKSQKEFVKQLKNPNAMIIDEIVSKKGNTVEIHKQISETHTNNHKGSGLLMGIQQKMVKQERKLSESYANDVDQIEEIGLKLSKQQGLFEIKWQQRKDGLSPFSEYYQYDQLKLIAPLLIIEFLEASLMVKTKNQLYIPRYKGPGSNKEENQCLLERFLCGDKQQSVESTEEVAADEDEYLTGERTKNSKNEVNRENETVELDEQVDEEDEELE